MLPRHAPTAYGPIAFVDLASFRLQLAVCSGSIAHPFALPKTGSPAGAGKPYKSTSVFGLWAVTQRIRYRCDPYGSRLSARRQPPHRPCRFRPYALAASIRFRTSFMGSSTLARAAAPCCSMANLKPHAWSSSRLVETRRDLRVSSWSIL